MFWKKDVYSPEKCFLLIRKQVESFPMKRSKTRSPARSHIKAGSNENLLDINDLPRPPFVHEANHETVLQRQRAFGYTEEELRMLIEPMATKGEEAIGSMGNDTPLAVLSYKPQLLYNYFKQLFAQVTNPPIDSIREEFVTSSNVMIGRDENLFEPTEKAVHQIKLNSFVLTNEELEKLRLMGAFGKRLGKMRF